MRALWKQPGERARIYRFGEFTFDRSTRRLSRKGQNIPLTQQAAIVLDLLLREAGTLVTREQIGSALWPQFSPAHPDAGINNIISKLRQLLDNDAELIRNIAGAGYIFSGAVRGSWPITAGLVFAAALATGLAAFTTAVGMAAVLYGVFILLLIPAFDRVKDTALTRGAASTMLVFGMAYIPSAWTLYQLSGEVINFDALPPAALYPFVTGMKFLPLFTLVLMRWTIDATLPEPTPWLRSPVTFWVAATLFMGMTAASLAAYSGEVEIISGSVPGWTRLVTGYVYVFAVNLGFAGVALHVLKSADAKRNQHLLLACAFAWAMLLPGAIVIGTEYNSINRHFLSSRRRDVYRAHNPDSAQPILRDTGRADIGPDLRHLLEDPEFIAELRGSRFYRVDLDERFQLRRHAVTFGYEDRSSRADRPLFRLVRLPADVAAALNFQRTRD